MLLLVLLLLESFSIYQQLLFSPVEPLRATLGFITPKILQYQQQLLFSPVEPFRATLGFITAKILQYLTTIVILSRRAASCYSYPSVSNNCYSVPACRFVLLLDLLLLKSSSIYQQLLFCPGVPLRATLGFITAKIIQYQPTIVIQSRRAASCYSWFYYF